MGSCKMKEWLFIKALCSVYAVTHATPTLTSIIRAKYGVGKYMYF